MLSDVLFLLGKQLRRHWIMEDPFVKGITEHVEREIWTLGPPGEKNQPYPQP